MGVKIREIEFGGHPNAANLAFFCPGCQCSHGIKSRNGEGWKFNGDMERPTISPSILVRSHDSNGATVCHSFVTDGRIQFLDDCTHKYAGQTLDLEDF